MKSLKPNTYIYKLTLIDGSTYIGQRHCLCPPEEDTSYLGSSISFNKKDVIKKEILIKGQFDDKKLAILETEAIKKDKLENPKNLNITLGAAAFNCYAYTKMHSEECKEKMRKRAKERWENPLVREKLVAARGMQMKVPGRKEKISKRVRETCSDAKWKEEHSAAIKKAFRLKEKDPEFLKRLETVRKNNGELQRLKVRVLKEFFGDSYEYKKHRSLLTGCKTEKEMRDKLNSLS